MTPPERPEVGALFAEAFVHIRGAHKGDEGAEPCEWCILAGEQAAEAAEKIGLTAAEPLRGALDPDAADDDLDEQVRAFFAARDAAIRDVLGYGASPPEYPGLALVPVASLERLREVWKPTRAALEATAPSTPEPALDPVTFRESLRANLFDGDERGTVTMPISKLLDEIIEIVALTSEPRAAAPQEGDEG